MNLHVTVSLSQERLDRLESWYRALGYKNRSEAVSALIDRLELTEQPKARVVERDDY